MSDTAASARAPAFSLRDMAVVARFELFEAVRTRLLLVMTILFVGAGALGAWGFAEALQRVEANAAEVLRAPATRKPGGTLRRMRDSRSYRDLLRSFTGSDEKADHFAAIPPIAVFFAWASFLFTPWLLLFTASETIAAEVASRAIRYAALRTSRLSYAVGKMAGQVAILVAVTALMGVTFFAVAALRLSGFEAGATAAALLSYWPRILLFNLPFLAFALCASMVAGSANQARLVALCGAVGLAIVSGLAAKSSWRETPTAAAIWDLVALLTPFGHKDGLFFPPSGTLASDILVCVALTIGYFAIGYAVLRRRDI